MKITEISQYESEPQFFQFGSHCENQYGGLVEFQIPEYESKLYLSFVERCTQSFGVKKDGQFKKIVHNLSKEEKMEFYDLVNKIFSLEKDQTTTNVNLPKWLEKEIVN